MGFNDIIYQTPDVCEAITNGIKRIVTTDLLTVTIISTIYFTAVVQNENVLYQTLKIVLQITLIYAMPRACLY